MFNLAIHRLSVWAPHLKSYNDDYRESFESWWGKHEVELNHLHPQIAEQWIHKHWFESPFSFIPLETLQWQLTIMSGDKILSCIHRAYDHQLDPEYDYKRFHPGVASWQNPTSRALDSGTWDYPIIVLSTPSGVLCDHGEFPGARLVLVEGHQRHRYLNALHARKTPPKGPHKVFILESPLINFH